VKGVYFVEFSAVIRADSVLDLGRITAAWLGQIGTAELLVPEEVIEGDLMVGVDEPPAPLN
jgi:hypothetical protein